MTETIFKECYVCHENTNYSTGCDTKTGYVCNFCVEVWLKQYIYMISPLKWARQFWEEQE